MLDADLLRADFPILQQVLHGDRPLAYLDNAATTHCPRSVIEAVTHLLEHDYASVHRGIHTLSERTTELFEVVRELVRRFIGAAEMEEVVFTRGATEAINLVARS